MLLNIKEEEIGIKASLLTFSEEITTDELKDAVSHLANLSTGIIV